MALPSWPVIRPVIARLPDADSVFGFAVQLVAGLDLESLVERVHVARRPVGAEFARAVRIDTEALAQVVVAVQPAPDLRPANEEPLIGAEAADGCGRPAGKRDDVGLVGNGQ